MFRCVKSLIVPLSACLFVASGSVVWPAAPLQKSIYDGLDENQMRLAKGAVQTALEKNLSYETRRWSVAGQAMDGFVVPMRTYKIKSGHYCREFLEGVTFGEKGTVSLLQTACRSDAGEWIIVKPIDSE